MTLVFLKKLSFHLNFTLKNFFSNCEIMNNLFEEVCSTYFYILAHVSDLDKIVCVCTRFKKSHDPTEAEKKSQIYQLLNQCFSTPSPRTDLSPRNVLMSPRAH